MVVENGAEGKKRAYIDDITKGQYRQYDNEVAKEYQKGNRNKG